MNQRTNLINKNSYFSHIISNYIAVQKFFIEKNSSKHHRSIYIVQSQAQDFIICHWKLLWIDIFQNCFRTFSSGKCPCPVLYLQHGMCMHTGRWCFLKSIKFLIVSFWLFPSTTDIHKVFRIDIFL